MGLKEIVGLCLARMLWLASLMQPNSRELSLEFFCLRRAKNEYIQMDGLDRLDTP